MQPQQKVDGAEGILVDEIRLIDPAQQVGIHARSVAGDPIGGCGSQNVMADRAAGRIVDIEIDPHALARIERRIDVERGVIVQTL